MNRVDLYNMDCRDAMSLFLPDNSVDAIVCDPPYGLAFMGKKWDYDVPGVDIWAECLRVLKPGGHLLAFAGTRTQHRMAVRIEDAGFEIRDMIAWVYGCLDDATEVATEKGVMPHHKTKIGDRVLCYDVEHGEYSYQPILEIVEYDYSDTAYRLVGDFGEQVVSRNHRVIVERGGSEAFQLAEALECEARVPVLESLSALRKAVHGAYQGAGCAQQDVQSDLCKCADRSREHWSDATGSAQGRDDQVRGLRGECVEASSMAAQGGDADVQQGVQRGATRCGVGCTRAQGTGKLDSRIGSRLEGANDRGVEPGVEGWSDVSEQERCVRRSADQVRSMPSADVADGSVGRIRDGASVTGGVGDQSRADTGGVRSPHQPRCDGQPRGEPDAVCHERSTQGVRAWEGHRSAVVRVVPFHYTGKVWCLRVPTGAFVAVRNGVAFPTGNSGFPKSLDVSKALDKAAGAEREVFGVRTDGRGASPQKLNNHGKGDTGIGHADGSKQTYFETAPATDAARQWQGWGTALKPAMELITMARKPLGTCATNVLQMVESQLRERGVRGEILWKPESASAAAKSKRQTNSSPTEAQPVAGTSAKNVAESVTQNDGLHPLKNSERTMPHGANQSVSMCANTTSESATNYETKCLRPTEESAPAAESVSGTSSPSTTSMAEVQSIGSPSTGRFTTNSSERDSQPGTECFAGIATGLTGSTAHVHIKQDSNGFYIWPKGLPKFFAGTPLTVAANVLAHGTGALNIDGCRVAATDKTPAPVGVFLGSAIGPTGLRGERDGSADSLGRWPANLIHDGSSDVVAAFPQAKGQQGALTGSEPSDPRGDTGSAARFFYAAKASKKDREEGLDNAPQKTAGVGDERPSGSFNERLGKTPTAPRANHHPTVKPTDLMAYLCRLVTPPGGVVFDPFMGSGSTGKAALREGFGFIGCEMDAAYFAIAQARLAAVKVAA